ncbi:chromatin modification- protein VID21, partial [Coemansia sp. RSA 2320]
MDSNSSQRRNRLEQEQLLLLREYYFWSHASNSEIAKALDRSATNVFVNMEDSDTFRIFLQQYSNRPTFALNAVKLTGQEYWAADFAKASERSLESPRTSSEQMDIDGAGVGLRQAQGESVYDTDTTKLVHPDDIVFLSQLSPVSTAEVTIECDVKSVQIAEHSSAGHSYQEQIEEINARSTNMHNWMLRVQEQPLYSVISNSRKFVSTRDWDTVRDELIRIRVMERIEDLKEKGKWSFWQPRKHRAPPRGKAQWDYLLDEMVWMHADFTEERKLRVEMARLIASWVMDYHHAVDKSRYTVAGRRYVLPDDFGFKHTPQLDTCSLGAMVDAAEATSDAHVKSSSPFGTRPSSRSSDRSSLMAQQALGESDGNGGDVVGGGELGDVVAVPAVGFGEAGENTVMAGSSKSVGAETEPKVSDRKASDVVGMSARIENAGKRVDQDKKPAKFGGASGHDDHVVPSNTDMLESTLSIYQILAQMAQSEHIEDIIGDSVYTLQSLNSLQPYCPAWEEAYCDILDASPVVPICRTMWPDFEYDDMSGCDGHPVGVDGGVAATIDSHELFSLTSESSSGRTAGELDSHSSRSIFTRHMLAPPLLPMFTQANKTPRVSHSTAGQPLADTAIQQATSEACPGQAVFEWSAERDKLLAKVVQQYTGNWQLITETLNHAISLYGSRALSARICYERWVAIKDDYSLDRNVVQAGFDEPEYGARKMHNWSKQLVIQPAAAPLSAMQLATHLVSHSEARKVVNESRKKREAAAKPAAVAPREIKSVAGDQKVPTPGELAKLKFENDRRIHQLIIEQRQATAAAAALAMQQQRALNPQLQHIQLSRQIAALQAMLASGRGLQRPLTP